MSEAKILEGFISEAAFAAEVGKSIKTTRRWRNRPNGLPFAKAGQDVLIPIREAREWFEAQIQFPNVTR